MNGMHTIENETGNDVLNVLQNDKKRRRRKKKPREYNASSFFFSERTATILVDAIAPTTTTVVVDIDKTADENDRITLFIVDDGTTSSEKNIPSVIIVNCNEISYQHVSLKTKKKKKKKFCHGIQ
jgi:hypothetical protein